VCIDARAGTAYVRENPGGRARPFVDCGRENTMQSLLPTLLALAPLVAAIVILIRKPEAVVGLVDRIDTGVARQLHRCADAEDFGSRFVIRPLLWPFKRIGDLTSDIDDPYFKTALRVLAQGYLLVACVLCINGLPYVFGTLLVLALFFAAVQNLLNGSGASKPLYTGRDPDETPPAEKDQPAAGPPGDHAPPG
jgi:hypothetical protein